MRPFDEVDEMEGRSTWGRGAPRGGPGGAGPRGRLRGGFGPHGHGDHGPHGHGGGPGGRGGGPGGEGGDEWGFGAGGGWGPGGPGGRRGGPGGGPGAWEGGPGGPGGWGPPWRAGRRMRRGDIRMALLAGLLEGPAHGYELIQRLEARSGGAWRPSPGSVYPTLQLLQEEGLLTSRETEGKRVFELSDEGREAAGRAQQRGPFGSEEASAPRELRRAAATLMLAARQVALAGDEAQVGAAVAVITEARQRLYRLLAGDTPDGAAGGTPGGGSPGE